MSRLNSQSVYHSVDSSAVKEIKFEKDKLHVVFKNNKEYVYLNVPENVFNELMKAESFGTVFNKHVKNDYKFIDIGFKGK